MKIYWRSEQDTPTSRWKAFDANIWDIWALSAPPTPTAFLLPKSTNAQLSSLDLLWDVSYWGQQCLTLQVKLIGKAAGPDEGSCVHI